TTGLGSASAYTVEADFVVPAVANNDYRVLVVTDASREVYERDAEANNTLADTDIIALRHADLQISSVTLPTGANAVAGSLFRVDAQLTNAGQGRAVGGWKDAVYLSLDDKLSADDVRLDDLERVQDLAPGATVSLSYTVELPNGIEGAYRLLVVADADHDVPEVQDEQNNVAASPVVQISLAPYADLTVTNISAAAELIGDPVDLTINWTVANQGTGSGLQSEWIDRIVLSSDDKYSANDRVIGEFTHTGGLAVGESYSREEIIMLPPALEGRFHLLVVTDAAEQVYEHTNAAPNVGVMDHFLDVVPRRYADLVVDSVIAETNGSSGSPLEITWAVSNIGIGTTQPGEWSDRIYVTRDATGATGRRQIASFTHLGALPTTGNYSRTEAVTLPSDLDGVYYVVVESSGTYEFIYTNNNSNVSDAVDVLYIPPPPADLSIESFDLVTQAPYVDNQQVEVRWTVRSEGPNALPTGWADRLQLVSLANNQVVRSWDFVHGEGLAAGKIRTRTEVVTLPQTAGQFRFVLVGDVRKNLIETDELNNELQSDPFEMQLRPRPDLAVTEIVAPTRIDAGKIIDVNFTVKNISLTPTPTGGSRWVDRVYISFDRQWGGDYYLGELQNARALGALEEYTSFGQFQLPQALAGEEIYVLVVADGGRAVDEFPNEANNVFWSRISIDAEPVPPPDLVTEQVFGPLDA
ncbi:MAG: hypothetical protein KDB23_28490, partial [Planctomycetales bacterium]|nr:hypothetical protein [Planctomycetales bacterium]